LHTEKVVCNWINSFGFIFTQ